MKLYANLHLHTTHSDGVYSPSEIVRVAKEEGYRALAISDHDTATGYPEFARACRDAGIECIFAVEFTVKEPKSYHVVGFDFDPEYPPMREYLRKMGERQTDNTKHCFDEAVQKGSITGITWDEVLRYNEGVIWLCNNHVFETMKAKGLVRTEEYYEWFTENFLHQRRKYPPCHSVLPLRALVDMIKAAGGFAVVAHPHGQLDDVDALIEAGVEGIEVWHPDLTEEEKLRAHEIALEKGLYISGGSDHSGLCGGYYSSFTTEETLRASHFYIEPQSVGTTETYFRELKTRKKNR